jgi:hypothetical protein
VDRRNPTDATVAPLRPSETAWGWTPMVH